MSWCEICHQYRKTEAHHVFEGRNRKNSDKYGAVIHICRECHRDIHDHPAKYEWLKKQWQDKLMAWNGWSLDDWLAIFRRNYE